MDRLFLAPDATRDGLASAIVALGDSLGLEVIAEGIERVEQMVQLRGLGCGYGQGFYFAKPMPSDELVEHLARGTGAARATVAAAGR